MRLPVLPLVCIFILPATSLAQGKAAIAREAAEYVLGRFGKEAAKEGLEGLTRKIELLALKHGDEAVGAVRKVGPGTFRLVEEAGEHGLDAVKLMARYGDDAVWVVAKKNRMAIFVKYGDNAGEAMMRHGEVAEPLLDAAGKSAAGALKAVSTQNGRRLAIMQSEGELARIGRTPELLDVVAKYGDRAMEFVWKNKGPLAAAAVLAAFLANPKPFIDGTADITKVVADSAVKPLATASSQALTDVARGIDWMLVAVCGLCVAGSLLGIRLLLRRPVSGLRAAKSDEPGAAADGASTPAPPLS
jgi:hypothetical protein